LISPFGLYLIVVGLAAARRFKLTLFTRPAERDYALYLGVTSAMLILFTWLWNPDYGARKDWDLFAPSAFVYTLFAGYVWVRLVADRARLAEAGLFVIAVSLLHSGAWIFANTQPLPRE
jgi:hypothetical protein